VYLGTPYASFLNKILINYKKKKRTKYQRKQSAIKKLGAYATTTASNEVGTKLEERKLETDSP
jgi:hypothetical protein